VTHLDVDDKQLSVAAGALSRLVAGDLARSLPTQ
jgi:hypothetical protein